MLVNGVIFKCDGNFLNDFAVHRVAGTNIYVSPYPQSDADCNLIKSNQITGVLDLLTPGDVKMNKLNHLKI